VLEEDLEDEDLLGASDEESEAEPAAKESVCVAREAHSRQRCPCGLGIWPV
jgi:hypothetical protein